MFAELAHELVGAHRRLVELDALVAVTFGDFFAPHENPGPDALRAGIAAPDPSGVHGDEEQAEGGDDQHAGQQNEILRPEGGAENEELALRQVPPHGLMTAPVQPHRAEIQQEQQGSAGHPQVAKQAGEGAGVDFFPGGVEVDAVVRVLGGWSDVVYRNLVAHHCIPRQWKNASVSTCRPRSKRGVAVAQ
ncbi:hypothetical protein D3C72_987390 [compost metagenome]